MQLLIHNLALAALCALLVIAAIGDLKSYIIPNWLNAAVALLAIPFWLTSARLGWPQMGEQALVAGCALLVFGGLFAAGWMGGGDVKLLVALGLWLPWVFYLRMFMAVAVLGGLQTLIFMALHRLRRREGVPEIPYGVAIACGALLLLGEPIVKHFPG